MPKAKAKAKPVPSLSGLVDSDMEEDTRLSEVDVMMPTPESNQENAVPTKKARGKGKTAANRFTKPRRASGGPVVAKKKAAPRKKAASTRQPLKEQTNGQHASDTEEVEGFEKHGGDDMEVGKPETLVAKPPKGKQPAKRGVPGARTTKAAEGNVLQLVKGIENDGEFEYTPTAVRQSKPADKTSLVAQNPSLSKDQESIEPRRPQKVIPETQEEPMDIDESVFVEGDDAAEEPVPQSVFRPVGNSRPNTRQRQPPVARRRAGSASDTERAGNDPSLRRKLGELTKKFENLEVRYRNLREVGVKEAEANFEKLKEQSESKTKVANDLIASLKKELASQKAIAQESRLLQKQITTKDSEFAKVQAKVDELSSAVSESHNENKVLQAKLANSRSASTVVESVNAKTPGSALRGKGQTRTLMVGSAEAAQAAQVAQLKEDLYSDLTGLILRGVDRGEESDIYDCIQTGRNGTLHFKLAVANDNDGKVGSYEDTEFQYTPRLDSSRDRDLLELLPDYLSEEITFSRMNAAKFYGRVVETLTKRRVED